MAGKNDVKIVLSAQDKTKPAFNSAAASLSKLQGSAIKINAALGAFGAALSVAGLAAFAKSGIDAADALNDMSVRLGVSVKDLASLKLAAEQSGTSLEGVGAGIARLTRSMGEAEAGNEKLQAALKELGISSRDPKEAFFQLADAVKRIEDPSQRAALMSAVLGKSYQDLIPLLAQGGDELRKSAKQSENFAEAMSKLAPDADRFNDQMAEMKMKTAALGASLLTEMMPAINSISAAMAEAAKEGGILSAIWVGLGGAGAALFTDEFANNSKKIKSLTQDLHDMQRHLPDVEHGGALQRWMYGSKDELKNKIEATKKQIEDLKKAGEPKKPAATAPVKNLGLDLEAKPKQNTKKTTIDPSIRQEAAALARAEEALSKARADASAMALDTSLSARREKLEQDRRAELIDEEAFIAAKAMLDEEALRNEIAALQEQQASLRAIAGDNKSKQSDKTAALADLAMVEARIDTAASKILNLNTAAAAELAGLASEKLKAQTDFIGKLEQEASLAGMSNEERERTLLLLEAEKLGITDINRLLELQGQIQQVANDKKAAEELQRQQDDLYQSVQQGVQRAFADGLNAIASGEGGIEGALQGFVNMVRSALSNALAASLTESFLGMLGGKDGVLGMADLFGMGGSKPDGSTPSKAIYVKDISSKTGAAGEGGDIFSSVDKLLGGEGGASVTGYMPAAGEWNNIITPETTIFDGYDTWAADLTSGIDSTFGAMDLGISDAFSSLSSGTGDLFGSFSDLFSGFDMGSLFGMFGFSDGGYTGDGGTYQPKGVVHGGEYVFSKASVQRLGVGALENLHRFARGGFAPSGPRLSYAEGGLVSLPGSATPNVTSNTKVINMFDLDSALAEYLNTRGGERAILNVIQRNPGAARG